MLRESKLLSLWCVAASITDYMQYGPIMNGGIRARGDATVRYRTILRVVVSANYKNLFSCLLKVR